MKKSIWLAMLMWAFYVMQPGYALALTCLEPGTIEQKYQDYDGIILAEVTEVKAGKTQLIVQLEIKKSFKGVEVDRLSILEEVYKDSDSRQSKEGKEYLYFLKNVDGQWEHKLCSPTIKSAVAADELDYLKDKEMKLQPASEAPSTPESDETSIPLEADDTPNPIKSDKASPSDADDEVKSKQGVNGTAVVIIIIALAVAGVGIMTFLRMRKGK